MGRADIATLPRLTPGVRLCLHPRALVGSAYDGHRHVGTPETCVAPRRNVMRPLRDARASREAISLRTLLRAQSLRGHNGTAGPPPNLRWTIFGGIRDVRLTSPVSSDADKASHPRVPDRTYLSNQMWEIVLVSRLSSPLVATKLVIRCADCGCAPDECREAPSAVDCPACKLDECCCWDAVHGVTEFD